MSRKLTLSTLSFLCLALPLSWVAACSSSSDGNASGDAGANGPMGGDGDGDGDTGGDGDGDSGTGNGSNNGDGDGDGDGDTGGDGDGDGDADAGGNVGAGGTGPGARQGEVNCMAAGHPEPDLMFYYGFESYCTSTNGQMGMMLNEMQVMATESSCTFWEGTLVDACPTENLVAYCAGDSFTSTGILHDTRHVYESAVTPDAESVARNAFAICGALTVYDLDDNQLVANCTGTVTASVDGEPVDFSDNLLCTFRADGTRSTYYVRATANYNTTDSKELTLKIIQDENGEMFYEEANMPGYGYLEGLTGFGAYVFATENTDPMVTVDSYSATGEGFAGTFSIGEISGASASNVRVITDGEIDIQFTVE